ncbi:MAG: MBL fold metallo-hydrolase [Chloroflexi bacterium]|nr:MBL fold metallo-hydrolase [Chloroflexota bacterium]
MEAITLAPDLYLLSGAVWTGVLVSGRKALLFDCCDTVTLERLAALGVDSVEMVLCTQHRRPNVAGAYAFVEQGARVIAPAGERRLFEEVEAYWNDPANRWHIYHHQPGPQVLTRPLPVSRAVGEGDEIAWEGYTVRVLDTPGATEGSVSYLVQVGGETVCFCGDTLYAPGQLWDFRSLQKGTDEIMDYHAFLGNKRLLIPSLHKLAASGASRLVPSHGVVMDDPQAAVDLTLKRLDAVWRNYAAISALNYYFPRFLDDTKDDPLRMAPAANHEPPSFVRRVAYTSYAIVSDSGAALLTDCGDPSVVETLQDWIRQGAIQGVDACWVTHYHDDHVDALPVLREAFGCPIMTDEHMAEVIEHPLRFFLPCISPNGVPVALRTTERQTWRWREFQLTAFHFPGQTYYHSGLLVEGHGKKVFFAGDSGAPTGLDDYCAPNRVFLGAGRGSRRCLDIWREVQPDYIFNQHQPQAFSFTDEELDYMERVLIERERVYGEMLPWAHPDFGTDESWVRAYPFEQQVERAEPFAVQVQFTNHGPQVARAQVEPVLPDGWRWDRQRGASVVEVSPQTDGSVDAYCARPDGAVTLWLVAPAEAAAGRYVVPFRVTWDGRYLGQYRHAVVVLS